MPSFTYTGPARTLVLAGARLTRGVPTELAGRAAEAAAAHPDVVDADSAPDQPPQPTALEELVAWLEGQGTTDNVDRDELLTRLRALDADALKAIAEEYELEVEIETDVDDESLDAVADAILGIEPEETPAPPRDRAALIESLEKVEINDLRTEASRRKLDTRGDRPTLAARIADAIIAEEATAAGGQGS